MLEHDIQIECIVHNPSDSLSLGMVEVLSALARSYFIVGDRCERNQSIALFG